MYNQIGIYLENITFCYDELHIWWAGACLWKLNGFRQSLLLIMASKSYLFSVLFLTVPLPNADTVEGLKENSSAFVTGYIVLLLG